MPLNGLGPHYSAPEGSVACKKCVSDRGSVEPTQGLSPLKELLKHLSDSK